MSAMYMPETEGCAEGWIAGEQGRGSCDRQAFFVPNTWRSGASEGNLVMASRLWLLTQAHGFHHLLRTLFLAAASPRIKACRLSSR